ncbi:MAG: DUF4012 domain-containing protein [Acidimicrobiales bacterium]
MSDTGSTSSPSEPPGADAPVPAPTPGTPRRRHRRRRRIMWAVVAVVVVWAAVAAAYLAFGILDASHGMADVQRAKGELSVSDVVSRSATAPLEAARRSFEAAGNLLHSPVLAPLDIVPVIGRQLRSVQDLSSASAQVARIGAAAISRAHGVLHDPHTTGPERVAALRRLAALASSTDGQLARVDTGPADALLPGLDSKHDTFVRDLAQVRSRLRHASAVAGTVATLLQGPRTYLLLMGNNAEMRAGSGNFLEVGTLQTDDGAFTLTGVQPTVDIPVPEGKVTPTGDLAARWGWLKPGVDWRNIGLTPQFDVNGPLAVQMWEAETGQHVDGVLAVDVEALHQLLEVTGPVTLPSGEEVFPSDVVQLLLHNQYEGESDAQTNQQAQIEAGREERLGALAKATLDALEHQSLDLTSLSDAMAAATQGRHLLAWSASASAEAAWEEAGVAGRLGPGSLLAAVINRGGNKLDQYLSVSDALTLTPAGSRTDATLTVRLANHTPPGQSQFIAGPYPGLDAVYGEYLGILAVNVPGYASTPHIDGAPTLDALGAEGPAWLIATPVDVKAGASAQFVVRFTLPLAHGQISVVPSARADPITWSYRGATYSDDKSVTLSY